MQKYQDCIVTGTGDAVESAAVQVLTYPGGVVATIYSGNGSPVTSNPLLTDARGRFSFYAADGRYSLSITKVGIAPITVSDILLEDQADGSAALAASGGAALVGFAPSGSGGITETVNAALQRMPHSAQYGSAAQFNTVQAALTGTVGFKSISIGNGGNSQLQNLVFPSTDPATNAPYAFATNFGTFNGVTDCNFAYGYNGDGAYASEPRFYDTFESHYYDGVTHWVEQNKEFYTAAGVNTRVYGMQVNRANGQADFGWVGPLGITFYADALNGTVMQRWEPGQIGIFANPVTGTGINIGGTPNTNADQVGLLYSPTLGSLVNGHGAVGIKSAVGTVAAAITIANLYQFAANDGTKGAGSAITNQFGFAVGDLVNATNNYAFEGLVTSGANKWNLHMSGTAQNLLTGVTGIGIAASSTAALTLAAGTTAVASLRIPHGAAPTSPVNGDLWTTSAGGLFVRINGVTVGPLT